MTDLDKTERDRNRGVRARELLDNPLMVESFAAVRSEYISAWEQSPARDAEGREKLWLMVRTMDKIRGHLEQMVDNGKIADKELADFQEKSKLRKIFG